MRRTLYALAVLAALAALAAPAAALTPDDLTPDEQTAYQAYQNNPTSAKNFLITREYVRKAQAVLNGELQKMPGKPQGFSARYLLPGDDATISNAIKVSVSGSLGPLWA